jgi:tryptophan synthase beta chain
MVPIKGDGLRYHAASPILSLLRHRGMLDTVAYPPDEKYVFEKTKLFVQKEGFLPAPDSAYSVCAAIDEALACKEKNEEKVIAFNISGHGLLDLDGYQEVLKF